MPVELPSGQGLPVSVSPEFDVLAADAVHGRIRFDAAARAFLGRPADALPWATKIHEPGVMALIEVGDAIEALLPG